MSASSRVQTTCSVSDAKPEIPSAAAARPGRATASRLWPVLRLDLFALDLPTGTFIPAVLSTTAPAAVGTVLAIHHAPAAAITFRATPAHVVPERPSVGSRTKPATSAPAAAPTVFAA